LGLPLVGPKNKTFFVFWSPYRVAVRALACRSVTNCNQLTNLRTASVWTAGLKWAGQMGPGEIRKKNGAQQARARAASAHMAVRKTSAPVRNRAHVGLHAQRLVGDKAGGRIYQRVELIKKYTEQPSRRLCGTERESSAKKLRSGCSNALCFWSSHNNTGTVRLFLSGVKKIKSVERRDAHTDTDTHSAARQSNMVNHTIPAVNACGHHRTGKQQREALCKIGCAVCTRECKTCAARLLRSA